MKKILNKINFALIGLMVSVPAFAAIGKLDCKAVSGIQDVFKLLRTMAFIGAAFYIASWAWGFISAGEAKPDDIKKRGVGLLVGFSLLFLVGILLSLLIGITGNDIDCAKELTTGW